MADFCDASLTPRARRMAEWLCDVSDRTQWVKFREASSDMLLRELPDHWTADDLAEASRDLRMQVGPRASRCAWLTAAGWLVGEEERLPPRPSQQMSSAARETAQRQLRTILATLATQVRVQSGKAA